MPVWSLSDVVKIVFKFAFYSSFVLALAQFFIWFVGFVTRTYNYITEASNSAVSQHVPSLLGCLMHVLGIDAWITSAFAIFYSASMFWIVAVSYILTYKLGEKVYKGALQVFT